MDRIVEVKINGNHVTKDSQYAGVQGEANVTALRIEFDEGWDGFTKTITWHDARGENPVARLLTADLLEDLTASTRIYLTYVPQEALTTDGKCLFYVDGYINGKRAKSAYAEMVVKPNGTGVDSIIDQPTPSQAEQIQTQIDVLLGDMQAEAVRAETAADNAEAAQQAAEDAQTGAETARGLSETAQEAAETAKAGAETARAGAETAQKNAETAAGAAAQRATNEVKALLEADIQTSADMVLAARQQAENAQASAMAAEEAATAAEEAAKHAEEVTGGDYYVTNEEFEKRMAAVPKGADWLAEEGADGHIKNKPFGYYKVEVEYVVFENELYFSDDSSWGMSASFTGGDALLAGEMYIVTVDGESIMRTAYMFNDGYNDSCMLGSFDDGDPFVVEQINGTHTVNHIYLLNGASTGYHTVKVEQINYDPVKVPDEYLPDTMKGMVYIGENGGYMGAWGNWVAMAKSDDDAVMIAITQTAANTNKKYVARTTDGVIWKAAELLLSIPPTDIAYGNGVFVIVFEYDSRGVYSTDYGLTWHESNMIQGGQWVAVVYDGSRFVALEKGGTIAYSTDGVEWELDYEGLNHVGYYWGKMMYGNGMFVAYSSQDGTIAYSEDGITWTGGNMPNAPSGMACGGGVFLMVDTDGDIWESTDLVNWDNTSQLYDDTGYYMPTGIGYGNGQFIIFGMNEALDTPWVVLIRTDGGEYSRHTIGIYCYDPVIYFRDKWVAMGGYYRTHVAYSYDGVTWMSEGKFLSTYKGGEARQEIAELLGIPALGARLAALEAAMAESLKL